jgi:putative FmdB family regulatory protein
LPTYIYNCKRCGEFEHQNSIHDDTLTVCPKCGGKDIIKVISAGAGFVFKGSGFYETDYKRGSGSDYANKASADKAPPPVPEACKACEKAKGCPHAEGK